MKTAGRWIAAAALITAMTAAAELCGESEIIFPETAALAVGAWLAPRQPWRVSPLKMFAAVGVCALCGVMIVRFLAMPLLLQLLLGYAVAAVVLTCFDITLIPVISAIILPILLSTDSWIYPAAAALLAGAVALGRQYLRHNGGASPQPPAEAATLAQRLLPWAGRLPVVAAVAAGALLAGAPFAVAPPLLVGFTELTNAESPARSHPLRIWALTFFAAVCGCGARLLVCELAGLPLTLAALLTIAAFLTVTAKTRLFFPPAAAIAVLPMLVESEALWLFPVQVGLGFGALTFLALLLFGGGWTRRGAH